MKTILLGLFIGVMLVYPVVSFAEPPPELKISKIDYYEVAILAENVTFDFADVSGPFPVKLTTFEKLREIKAEPLKYFRKPRDGLSCNTKKYLLNNK